MYSPAVLFLKAIVRWFRGLFGLAPIQKVMRIIQSHGYTLKNCEVLETFAGDGSMQIADYVKKVGRITAWEWGSDKIYALRNNFPQVRAIQTDSFERIESEEPGKFDIVVIDASPKSCGHFEVFDMFPAAFRMLRQSGVFVCTVVPEINHDLLLHYPELNCPEYLEARSKFYRTPTEHVNVVWPYMDLAFRRIARNAGFQLTWSTVVRRNSYIVYYVFGVQPRESSRPDRMTEGNVAQTTGKPLGIPLG